MKLYEITGEMLQAIEKYNSVETDEELNALGELLQNIQIAFNEKAAAVGFHIRNRSADIDAIEREIARLQELKKSAEKEVEFFKNYLYHAMVQTGTPKITTSTLKLAIQKNPPSCVVVDASLVPQDYKRVIPEHWEIDKKKIIETWKATGVGVEGTVIEQKERVAIK